MEHLFNTFVTNGLTPDIFVEKAFARLMYVVLFCSRDEEMRGLKNHKTSCATFAGCNWLTPETLSYLYPN